tara:strand:- start:292 stop:1248 length:957 start_codon:yes stop_codon:yes gene_type:complete
MVSETNLLYPAHTSGTKYINIAKDLAASNGKNEEITTRDGHLYAYIVELQSFASADSFNQIITIPNTWRVRNAFRKFHFAREHMFEQAGLTKSEMGKYGQTMRPYMTLSHRKDGELDPKVADIGGEGVDPVARDYTGGEWSYTQLASSPTVLDTQNAGTLNLPLADSWNIHVLGGSKSGADAGGVKVWDSVGMVNAYNQDRMDQMPDADDTTYPGSSVEGLNNPLASLRTQSLTSGEIVDIAKDQEEEKPPYDILDNGDSQDGVYAQTFFMKSAGEASTRRLGTIVVPAGLMAIQSSATNGNGLILNVVGKVLCKDLE